MRKIILIVTSCITLVVLMLGAPHTAQAQTPTPTSLPPIVYGVPFTLNWTANTPNPPNVWNGTENTSTTIQVGTGVVVGATLYSSSKSGGAWNCGAYVYVTGTGASLDATTLNTLWSGNSADTTFGTAGYTNRAGFVSAKGLSGITNNGPFTTAGGTITVSGHMQAPGPDNCNGANWIVSGVVWVYGSNYPKEYQVCTPVGSSQTVDVLTNATVTAGSLTAVQTIDDPPANFESQIDVTFTSELPSPVAGPPGSQIPASLNVAVSNGQGGNLSWGLNPLLVTINGVEWRFQGVDGEISLPAGTTDLTIRIQGTISGLQADHYTYPPGVVGYVAITAPLANNGDSLICDGSFEWPSNTSPWQLTNQTFTDGRISSYLNPGVIVDGLPACGTNFYQVGKGAFGTSTYSPALNLFSWPGGTMYYKFRYRTTSADFFNIFSGWKGSPNLYLVTEDGAFVMDLFGSNVYDPSLDISTWRFIGGNAGSVAAGRYRLAVDLGYNAGDPNRTARVYYDDTAVGLSAFVDACSTWVDSDPSTATPVPTNTPTNTGTVTTTPTATDENTVHRTQTAVVLTAQAGTQTVTVTPRVLPSIRPSYTATVIGTPRATSTLRASATPRPSQTLSSGGQQTLTAQAPGLSSTPWGQSSSTPGGPTITPGGATATAQPAFDPLAWGFNLPKPDTVWNFTPGIGMTGDWTKDCNAPASWNGLQWIIPWVNWNFCRATSFITFGPSTQATAVAIPGMFTKYEPFGTIQEVGEGITTMRTEVAIYQTTPMSRDPGTADSVNPAAPIKTGGNNASPWDGNLNLHRVQSNGINESNGITSFDSGCKNEASAVLPGALAYGMCFVFGVARNIGVTPWMQFFLNIVFVLMPIRAALGLVGMGNQMMYIAKESGVDTSQFEAAKAAASKVPRPAPFRFGRRR